MRFMFRVVVRKKDTVSEHCRAFHPMCYCLNHLLHKKGKKGLKAGTGRHRSQFRSLRLEVTLAAPSLLWMINRVRNGTV